MPGEMVDLDVEPVVRDPEVRVDHLPGTEHETALAFEAGEPPLVESAL